MVRSCNPIAEVRGALAEIISQLFLSISGARGSMKDHKSHVRWLCFCSFDKNKMPQPEVTYEEFILT